MSQDSLGEFFLRKGCRALVNKLQIPSNLDLKKLCKLHLGISHDQAQSMAHALEVILVQLIVGLGQ